VNCNTLYCLIPKSILLFSTYTYIRIRFPDLSLAKFLDCSSFLVFAADIACESVLVIWQIKHPSTLLMY